MYVVIVEFIVKADYISSFRDRVRQQARDSLERESGCHVFDVCIDPERAELVVLYEVYIDPAAFDRHLATVHFVDFDARVQEWVSSKQVTRLQRI